MEKYTSKINELIREIGLKVVDSISEEWMAIFFSMKVCEGVTDTSGNYQVDGEKKHIDFMKLDPSIAFDILELHQIMNSTDISKWNIATLQINSEGKFDIDFSWDQEYFDEVNQTDY